MLEGTFNSHPPVGGKNETLKYLHNKFPEMSGAKADNDDTALTIACQFAGVETVKMMIEDFKLDVHQIGYQGRNCFLSAAEAGKNETLTYLHNNFPELVKTEDDFGETALTFICKWAPVSTVKLCIDQFKINVFEKNMHGKNAFDVAIRSGNTEVQ